MPSYKSFKWDVFTLDYLQTNEFVRACGFWDKLVPGQEPHALVHGRKVNIPHLVGHIHGKPLPRSYTIEDNDVQYDSIKPSIFNKGMVIKVKTGWVAKWGTVRIGGPYKTKPLAELAVQLEAENRQRRHPAPNNAHELMQRKQRVRGQFSSVLPFDSPLPF